MVQRDLVDRGRGAPIALIPGIQGRWEWMAPAARALERNYRVVTGSLCGEPGSGCRPDPSLEFETYTRQVGRWLDRAGVERAAVCGVSFGGLVALHFAAMNPDRVSALVLVSAPAPGWRPNAGQARDLAAPFRRAPAFLVRAPLRIWPEIRAARRSLPDAAAFAVRHAARVLSHPSSPARMAARGRLAATIDLAADCCRIDAPTLVVTGEPYLDRVVPVGGTRQYISRIRGAVGVEFERTGHIGLVTRPNRFAAIIGEFLSRGQVLR